MSEAVEVDRENGQYGRLARPVEQQRRLVCYYVLLGVFLEEIL